MHHFEKKNSKIFSLEGPRENVGGNASTGPAVALDGPTYVVILMQRCFTLSTASYSNNDDNFYVVRI